MPTPPNTRWPASSGNQSFQMERFQNIEKSSRIKVDPYFSLEHHICVFEKFCRSDTTGLEICHFKKNGHGTLRMQNANKYFQDEEKFKRILLQTYRDQQNASYEHDKIKPQEACVRSDHGRIHFKEYNEINTPRFQKWFQFFSKKNVAEIRLCCMVKTFYVEDAHTFSAYQFLQQRSLPRCAIQSCADAIVDSVAGRREVFIYSENACP